MKRTLVSIGLLALAIGIAAIVWYAAPLHRLAVRTAQIEHLLTATEIDMASELAATFLSLSDREWREYMAWSASDPQPNYDYGDFERAVAQAHGDEVAVAMCEPDMADTILHTSAGQSMLAPFRNWYPDIPEDRLAAFVGRVSEDTGLTPAKIRHDSWIYDTPVGQRCLQLMGSDASR